MRRNVRRTELIHLHAIHRRALPKSQAYDNNARHAALP
jgi:hypothetical protein